MSSEEVLWEMKITCCFMLWVSLTFCFFLESNYASIEIVYNPLINAPTFSLPPTAMLVTSPPPSSLPPPTPPTPPSSLESPAKEPPCNLKRKEPIPDEPVDRHPDPPSPPDPALSVSKGEYESGRIMCDDCGETVSIRDESGAYTSNLWKEHRKTQSVPPPISYPLSLLSLSF